MKIFEKNMQQARSVNTTPQEEISGLDAEWVALAPEGSTEGHSA